MTDQSNKSDDRRLYSPMPQVCKPAAPNQMKPAVPRPESELYRCPPEEFFRPKVEPPAGPGFYIVTKSIPARELDNLLFETTSTCSPKKFISLNPNIESVIKAGSMIVLSDLPHTVCTHEESVLMAAAREVKIALDPLTPEEADFMYDNLAAIASYVLSGTSTGLGVGAAMMESQLKKILGTLQAIEQLHQDSYRKHGHLNSAEFFAERKRLLDQLDDQFLKSTQLRKLSSLGGHDKLKKSLGISTRSLVHQWDKAGAPGQIPGYATHLNAISRAAKYMKAGGYIGIGLGVLSSAIHVWEVCSADSESQECKKVKVTEGAKVAGSVAGASAGGIIGGYGSAAVCVALVAITLPAGGVGGLACAVVALGGVGVGAYLGGEKGGEAAESIAEVIYERVLK